MSKKDTFLTILGLLIAVTFMAAMIWAVVGDVLKLIFIDNLDETVRSVGLWALIIGGFYIVAKVVDSLFGSKSSQYSKITGEYPENWDSIRAEVHRRDGHRCGNCGASAILHVHHIVPLSKGGTNNLSNLRTLCNSCHKKLHPHMRD